MILNIISVTFGVLGILFGVKCYHELWKWARICQSSRIAIAYKTKVKLQAPMTEWIAWTRLLDKDKDSQGRVIYRMGGTSVAITRADAKVSIRLREWIRIRMARRANAKRLGGEIPQGAKRQAIGTYSATDDKTGAKGGNRSAVS